MSDPIVAIIMGSKSDYSTMKKTSDVLDSFNITHTVEIMSAHRTPAKVSEFAKSAKDKGIKVIICGAGMSAHLAGVVASHTDIPVIGVPLSSSQGLGGIDALLSTTQMPKGVPVASVAINGSVNAALLAVKILALSDNAIYEKLSVYKDNMRKEIESASQKLKNGETP